MTTPKSPLLGRLAVHNELLLEGPSIIQAGKAVGMQAMDDALLAAAREGRVRPEEAMAKANDKARFQPLVAGGPAS